MLPMRCNPESGICQFGDGIRHEGCRISHSGFRILVSGSGSIHSETRIPHRDHLGFLYMRRFELTISLA